MTMLACPHIIYLIYRRVRDSVGLPSRHSQSSQLQGKLSAVADCDTGVVKPYERDRNSF